MSERTELDDALSKEVRERLLPRSINELFQLIGEYVWQCDLRLICHKAILTPEFLDAPASADKHHFYHGGLAVHTLEVLEIALSMADVMQADKQVLTVAAVWHDFMKIKEYVWRGARPMTEELMKQFDWNKDGTIGKTVYYNLIHHVVGSVAQFVAETKSMPDLPEDLSLAIQHAMLAHHGRREWGSPQEPRTKEALILHSADMLSARYGAGKDCQPFEAAAVV
jgi:putative nucleotidyltransferase with HDIG domain